MMSGLTHRVHVLSEVCTACPSCLYYRYTLGKSLTVSCGSGIIRPCIILYSLVTPRCPCVMSEFVVKSNEMRMGQTILGIDIGGEKLERGK